MVATPTSSPPTSVPFRRVHHRLASLTAVTSMFLGGIVPLVSLFVLEARGQSNNAQCKSGYDRVCNDLCFFLSRRSVSTFDVCATVLFAVSIDSEFPGPGSVCYWSPVR